MFAKVFQQILDSSLANDWQVRLVFEDFLKLATPDGIVDITRESIARRTNVPLEIVTRGIAELERPDKTSRTPDQEGRRILRLDEHRDWGWRIVNFQKYRESATKEMLRMGEAERKSEYRRRKGFPSALPSQKTEIQKKKQSSPVVVPDMSGQITKDPLEIPDNLKTPAFINVWSRWQTNRRGMKKPGNWALLFKAQLDWLKQFTVEKATAILETSIRNGWQGLFEDKSNGTTIRTNTRANPAYPRTAEENPRNANICKGVTDYAALGRARVEQREREKASRLGSQNPPNAPSPPTTTGNGA